MQVLFEEGLIGGNMVSNTSLVMIWHNFFTLNFNAVIQFGFGKYSRENIHYINLNLEQINILKISRTKLIEAINWKL